MLASFSIQLYPYLFDYSPFPSLFPSREGIE